MEYSTVGHSVDSGHSRVHGEEIRLPRHRNHLRDGLSRKCFQEHLQVRQVGHPPHKNTAGLIFNF